MHTENDNGTSQEATDGLDSAQEAMVHWLMDELDKDEPSEKLFVVDRQAPVDMSLSAFEAEIAARPMQRGRDGADSFDAYVGEEVVMSSESASSDIYSDNQNSSLSEDLEIEEVMALDFSRGDDVGVFEGQIDVQDGDDILGLEDEDDIGETYLKVKRVKKGAEQEVPQPAPVAPAVPEPEAAEPIAAQSTQEPVAAELTEEPVAAEIADEPIADAPVEEPAAEDTVEDYIASTPAPSDDDAFDDYLVAGAELSETEGDIGGLELVAMEPIVDVTPDEPVDLPEEVHEVAEVGESMLAAVMPLIGPLMEELNSALAQRLGEMGRPADAVYADFSMASDETSARMAREQDYAPVMDVFTRVPASLADLSDTQRAAVYLRLCWMDTGEICNNLFREAGDSGVIEMDTQPVLRAVDNTVFDEGILDEDLDADLAPSGWEPGQEETDIDALFDEFDGSNEDSARGAEALGDAEEQAQPTALELEPIQAPDEQPESAFEPAPEPEPEPEAAPEPEPVAVAASIAPAAPAGQDSTWCIPADLPFSHTAPEGGVVLENFLDAFVEEGTFEVARLGEIFDAWELSPGSDDIHKDIARCLHTLKGISKGVGLVGYGTLIENFEILFNGLPAPDTEGERRYFQIMHAWRDAAVQGVSAIKANRCDIGNVLPYAAMPEGMEPVVATTPPPAAVQPEPVATAPEPLAPEQEEPELPLIEAAPEELGELQQLASQEQVLRADSSDIFSAIMSRLAQVRDRVAGIDDAALHGELDGLAELIDRASRNNAEAEALLEQQSAAMQSLGGPAPAGAAEGAAGIDDAAPKPAAPVAPPPQEVEDGVFALVVDDSRTQRMVATSQLGTVGVETETAENGAVAIEWLNTTDRLPNIILLDVEMPVKDGIQTLREIRESSRFGHVPVIMVTSRTGAKHRTLAEEAGCDGYMGKPFNFRMLVSQINELTGQNLALES